MNCDEVFRPPPLHSPPYRSNFFAITKNKQHILPPTFSHVLRLKIAIPETGNFGLLKVPEFFSHNFRNF